MLPDGIEHHRKNGNEDDGTDDQHHPVQPLLLFGNPGHWRVQVELIDRFGLLPDAAKNLVAISEFKLQAAEMGIRRIEANAKGGVVEFADKTAVSPSYIIELIQKQSRIFKLEGGQKLRFTIASDDYAARLALIANMLSDFAKHKVTA